MRLRPYQEEAVATAVSEVQAGKNSLLVLPTASGKSHIVAGVAERIGKVLVLQPSLEILAQNVEKMRATGFEDIGIYSAGAKSRVVGAVTFATIGSVYKKPELFAGVVCIVVDEVHVLNFAKGMYKTIIEALGVPVVGLSASPYRLQLYTHSDSHKTAVEARMLNRIDDSIFKGLSHVTQMSAMFEAGYLARPVYDIRQGYDSKALKVTATGTDFSKAELKRMQKRLQIMERTAKAVHEVCYKNVLIFVTTVEEAEELATKLIAGGVQAESVSNKSKPKERERILEGFKAGTVRVVINVGVLTTGFDFPELECVILARPTTSVSLYIQMIGRVLRIADGKEVGHVIDFCGNVDRFGRVETFEFVKSKTGERLRSEVGYLTGYDFIGQKDIEADEYEGLTKSSGMGMPIWLVGKYKGTHISKVPTWYLENASQKLNWEAMRELATKELFIRANKI